MAAEEQKSILMRMCRRESSTHQMKQHNEPKINLQTITPEQNFETTFPPGFLVWGKLGRFPWWPGIVVDSSMCGMEKCDKMHRWIFWLAEGKVSKLTVGNLVDFISNFLKKFAKQNSVKYMPSVLEACKEYARKKQYIIDDWTDEEIISWAKGGFLPSTLLEEDTSNSDNGVLPFYIIQQLATIASLNHKVNDKQESEELKKQLKEQNQRLHHLNIKSHHSKFNQEIKKIIRKKLNIQDICLGCASKKNKSNNFQDHPLFEGGMCNPCMDNFKDTFFVMNNGFQVFCCVCGNKSKKMISCEDKMCQRVYCLQCSRMFSLENISEGQMRPCFFCKSSSKTSILRSKSTWRANLLKLFDTERKEEKIYSEFPRRDISVLSLYDVTGSVLQILQKCNIKISNYYYTRADIEVTGADITWKHNGKDIGHKNELGYKALSEIGQVDLLVGYLPVNIQATTQKVVTGDVLACELFMNFFMTFDILQEKMDGKKHLFWIFGTDIEISLALEDMVNRFMEKRPVCYSSSNRSKLFWTNIPSSGLTIPSLPSIIQILSLFFQVMEGSEI